MLSDEDAPDAPPTVIVAIGAALTSNGGMACPTMRLDVGDGGRAVQNQPFHGRTRIVIDVADLIAAFAKASKEEGVATEAVVRRELRQLAVKSGDADHER